MFHVFQITTPYDIIYLFVHEATWSSDFDNLEQLVDVGLDDSDKVTNPRFRNASVEQIMGMIPSDKDEILTHIGSVQELEDLYDLYPEYFI